ncbi:MAG: peptidoglycan bridge formation glycyltransferase FemA/FemB family protein [Candidatus Peribacter sp.]|jgi:lipid II:glycine glycyltransferase (peptidoglycan interpeptide bridge formation enzyme)|nr:peptidoglycan bridge formation glycyltransferase FemA/FemB family protein [Candidatus Peribacter sp.]MBT4393470.1 peptidoglycan bridge formation glycyltransferase FemA/FemB family protein [Candidatus Peribacter sp.]MBT4600829.1 peptidoglycan bridge formation glycyltransferase FemA/FemB family protein [Candidatus Peribacter sp.]MBT5149476.1 peptidoglycan bridge formation glycyltransferase FemA/FemB family protein [Candidatus Peribacter sp.]MBT5637325.1 peptidoglycan bridge formation glycyltra
MNTRILTSPEDLDRYDRWLKSSGLGNLWQSLERKAYLEALGKEVRIYVSEDDTHIHTSALVVTDRTTGGYCTWEIPRGPIGDGAKLLEKIIDDAKADKCLALYLSPSAPLITDWKSLTLSPRHIHCEATRIIDLTQSEEDILSQMKQKGRYNIKVAKKNNITIKESSDIDAFYNLVTKTGKRDGFVHLSKNKYEAFLQCNPGSFLLLAYDKQTEPIAGVLSVVWGERLIYYYGASNHAERAKMAPYLLQWESMRIGKAKGCTEYDLLGVAPPESSKTHPWAGISSFKEKFGGEVVMYPKEQMIILKPIAYHLLRIKRSLLG